MSIEKTAAFKTSDGALFEEIEDAKNHEFEKAFREWWTGVNGVTGEVEWLYSRLLDDRLKLLPIFKLLNGGNPITAPSILP